VTREEVIKKAESFGRWYHAVELLPGYHTQSMPFGDVWEQIRRVRANLPFENKTVLDLGTMDGLWAFDAEQRGARYVLAGDIWANPRLLFAREVRGSKIIPVPNADIHCLGDRLRSLMVFDRVQKFDVVQCMGVIYHVQNPLLALHQVRRVIAETGILVMESGCWMGGGDDPVLRMNRGEPKPYDDNSTYWLPNLACLKWMLTITGFTVIEETILRLKQQPTCERVALLAKPGPLHPTPDNYGGPVP
jgi:tRNA (mo5U34)-methyltransferase